MKIIILGATKVGIELAEYLVGGGHAVTLVDEPSLVLSRISTRLDLRVVQEHPSLPSALKKAGAENAELLAAVTDNDEVNITACCIAGYLFGIPNKTARIRARDYLTKAADLFGHNAIPIDNIICPELIAANAIIDLLEFEGAGCIGNFCDNRIVMMEVKCVKGGRLIGQKTAEILKLDERIKIAALHRGGESIADILNEPLQEDDALCLCCERSRAKSILTALIPSMGTAKVITIAGGSHIADELAERLSSRYKVKLLEPDHDRALRSADNLQDTGVEVFEANASNLEFLTEEHINKSDRFIAASNNDENNILSSLMLNSIDPVRTITVLRDASLGDMAKNSANAMDIVVSPREEIISELLSKIRQEGVEKVKLFCGGASLGMELKISGNKRSSKVIGKKVSDLTIPYGVVFALAVRDKKVMVIDDNFIFCEGDRIVTYLEEQQDAAALVKLFRPRPFWILMP